MFGLRLIPGHPIKPKKRYIYFNGERFDQHGNPASVKRKQPVIPFKFSFRTGLVGLLETNDCTVLALSETTPLSYTECHEILKQAGRRDRDGFRFVPWLCQNRLLDKGLRFDEVYDYLNSICITTFNSNNDCRGRTFYTKHLTLNQFIKQEPVGNYIVITKRHAIAIIDGVVHDRFKTGARKRIEHIFKVELV